MPRSSAIRSNCVIETHFHADFLSGHLELAKATGAKIVYSSVAETEFESMGVADGERLFAGRGDAGVPPHPRAHARIAEHRGLRASR